MIDVAAAGFWRRVFLLLAVLFAPVVASADAGGGGVCDARSSFCFGVDWEKASADDLAGIDIDDGAPPGRFSPMHAAIVHGSADNLEGLVHALVRMGADINAQDKVGLTPLHYAVFSRRAEDTLLLMRAGADVNIADDGGRTPLHIAGIFGWHSSTINELLRHGADAEKRN